MGWEHTLTDLDGGKMDGFVEVQRAAVQTYCQHNDDPNCVQGMMGGQPDVMGYHDRARFPTTGHTRRTSYFRITCLNRPHPGVCLHIFLWFRNGPQNAPATIR